MKTIFDEGIKYKERYLNQDKLSRVHVEEAIKFILKRIDENIEKFTYKFPAPSSENLIYEAIGNTVWTSSFWTGMLWLAYEITGDEKYRKVAEIQIQSFKERIEKNINADTHDLGFLYSLSCVAAYKLTGNEEAKEIALKAADHLIGRFREKGQFILSWGKINTPDNPRGNRFIIDCLMNLPLLYWATEVTGDRKYYDIASIHVWQTAKYIVREDASAFHTFYMDYETGEPLGGKTHQGYSDDSSWSRGQAWGIYGFPLSYIYTGDARLMDIAKKLTNYFINRLPEDEVCYWDLVFTSGEEERDSSAAATAVCGMLEMAKQLPLTDEYRSIYENAAQKILKSLIENYTTVEYPESNGILLHAVRNKPGNEGVDECCIFGDYYYFEALVRMIRDWKLYW